MPDIAKYGFVLRIAYIIASAIGIMLPLTFAMTLPFANYTSQLRSQIGLSVPDRDIQYDLALLGYALAGIVYVVRYASTQSI